MGRFPAMVKLGASVAIADMVDLVSPRPTAILFMGDRVPAPYSPTVDRLSKPENVASLLSRKLGLDYNVYVVGPPRYAWDSMACYDGYFHSISPWGSPVSYDPRNLPAATSTLSVLADLVREVRTCQRGVPRNQVSCPRHPATVVLGFSKGGVVLNQLMAELASLKTIRSAEYDASLPRTAEDLLQSIAEFHYLDVGLNDCCAYQTDEVVLGALAVAAGQKQGGLTVFMHGTPRQWMDPQRPWIAAEKDRCVQLLREVSSELGHGKLNIYERLYLVGKEPSLDMHFEILEEFEPLAQSS